MNPSDDTDNADTDDESAEYRDVFDADPIWLEDASPTAAAEYYRFTNTRSELLVAIGDQVGFDHDPDRDRLTKDELAKILVFAKAHNREL